MKTPVARHDPRLEAGRQQLREHIARNVRAARKRLKWTQTALATRLGVSVSAISAIERAEYLLHFDRMCDLAVVLDVSLASLLGEALRPAEAHLLALLRRRDPAMTDSLIQFLELDTPLQRCPLHTTETR